MIRSLLITLISVCFISCKKEVESRPGILGKEVSLDEVRTTIDEALKDSSIAYAKIGDSVEYEVNIRAELGAVARILKFQQTLVDIQNNQTEKTITFDIEQKKTEYNYTTGAIIDFVESQFEFALSYAGTSVVNAMSLKLLANQLNNDDGNSCDGVEETDNEGFTYDCIKYSNLSLKKSLIAPPDKVASKPNCMGLPNCMMRINTLKFDIVRWSPRRVVDIVNVSAEVSPDVPDVMYYSNNGALNYRWPTLSYCDRGYYNNTIITQCFVLRDFNIAP